MSTGPMRLHRSFPAADALWTALSHSLEGISSAVAHARKAAAGLLELVTAGLEAGASSAQLQALPAQLAASAIDVEALRAQSYGALLNHLQGGSPSSSGELRRRILAVEERAKA